MPGGLRWSWCNNNRNKVYNKCNTFESSWNHLLSPGPWKKLSSTKPVPGAKKVRAHSSKGSVISLNFHMRKLRHRVCTELAQHHTLSKGPDRVLNQSSRDHGFYQHPSKWLIPPAEAWWGAKELMVGLGQAGYWAKVRSPWCKWLEELSLLRNV